MFQIKKFLLSALFLPFFTILVLFSLISCTRPTNKQSKLNVNIPSTINKSDLKKVASRSVKAFADDLVLAHVVVNVSGPGIDPVVVANFDAEDQCQNCTSPLPLSSSISLPMSIPAGSNRLVEVLAVYASPSDPNLGAFYYGDNSAQPAEFDKADVSVDIAVFLKGVANMRGGTLAGRYLMDSNSGPTGQVEILYRTPTGHRMVIERTPIVNGWFSAFILDEIPFDYVVKGTSQLVLFENSSMTRFSQEIASTTTQKMKIDIPDYYNVNNNESRKGESVILGYFGPGATTQKYVCSPSTYSFTKLMQAANHSAPLVYGQAGGVQVTGGSRCVIANVASADLWNNVIYFDPTFIDGRGSKESSGGFYSIFAFTSSTPPLNIDYVNATKIMSVSFSTLPGANQVADRVSLYFRNYSDSRDFERHHEPDCVNIDRGGYQFKRLADIAVTEAQTVYSTSFSTASTVGFDEALTYSSMGPQMVACVFSKNNPIASGISMTPGANSGGGSNNGGGGGAGGGSTSPYAWLHKNYPESYAVANSCFAFDLGLGNSSTPIANIQLLRNGSSVFVYSTLTDCSGNSGGQSTFSLSPNQFVQYWVAAGASGTTDTWSLSYGTGPQVMVTNGPATALGVELDMSGDMVQGYCYPVTARVRNAAGQNVTPATAINYVVTPPVGVQIFSDGNCQSQLASPATLTIAGGTGQNTFSLKLVSSLTNNGNSNLNIGPAAGSTVGFPSSRYISEATNIAVTGTNLWGSQFIQSGQCSDIYVELKNSYGQSIPGTANVYLGASNVTGSFYVDPGCSSPVANQALSFSNEIRKIVYFRAKTFVPNQNSYALTATVNATTTNYPINMNGAIGKINIVASTGLNRVPLNTCSEFIVSLKDLDGVPLTAPSTIAVNFFSSGGSVYDSLNACQGGGAGISSQVISQGQSQMSVWRNSGYGYFSMEAYLPGPTNTNWTLLSTWGEFVATDSGEIASLHSAMVRDAYMSHNQCVNGIIKLESLSVNDGAYNSTGSDIVFTPLLTGPVTGEFYQGYDCKGAPSQSIAITPGNSMGMFSMRMTSGGPDFELSFSGGYSTNSVLLHVASPTVIQYSLRSYNGDGYIAENSTESSHYHQGVVACDGFYVRGHNSLGVAVSEDYSGVLTIIENAQLPIFYHNNNCSDTPTAQIDLAVSPGQTGSAPIYVRITDANLHTISFKRDGISFGSPTLLSRVVVKTPVSELSREPMARKISVLQSDGKLIIGGSYLNGGNLDFMLKRFNTDGTPDTTFGTSGKTITDLAGGTPDNLIGVALQPDGKILAYGYTTPNGGTPDFALVRYDTNGVLDSSFNSTGIVITDVASQYNVPSSLVVQADGKILVGGTAITSGDYNFVIARYSSTGGLDTSFGSGTGMVQADIGSYTHDELRSLVVQSDGAIIAGGLTMSPTSDDMALVRYSSYGYLDTSFGSGGKVILDITSTSRDDLYEIALQSDNRILLSGLTQTTANSDYDIAVARLNSDGSLDTSYNATGIRVLDLSNHQNDFIYGMKVQIDDRLVLIGSTHQNYSDVAMLLRLNTNGMSDSTFGNGGLFSMAGMDSTSGVGLSLNLLPNNGGYLAVGEGYGLNGPQIMFFQLTSNGL